MISANSTTRKVNLLSKMSLSRVKEQATNRLLVHPCPHRAERVSAIEERLNAYRA